MQVLELDGHFLRDQFMGTVDGFLTECGVKKNEVTTALKQALDEVVTQEQRQRNLERFIRVVIAQVGASSLAELSAVHDEIGIELGISSTYLPCSDLVHELWAETSNCGLPFSGCFCNGCNCVQLMQYLCLCE